MKVIIHGTKDGYTVLTEGDVRVIDARPSSNKVAAIGSFAYSLYYGDGIVLFNKYQIVREVAVANKRTGNIAFTVAIPINKELSGADLKNMLDELSKVYCDRGYIDEAHNVKEVKEDWDFIDTIKGKYVPKLSDSHNNYLSNYIQGNEDSAYIYYSSEAELVKLLDSPFQNEYKKYAQVFFVEEGFKDKDNNPLNALKHDPKSDLTDVLKSGMSVFELLDFNGKGEKGVEIQIKVNGVDQTTVKNFNRGDEIEIIYSKPYHKSDCKKGMIHQLGELNGYLVVEKNNRLRIKTNIVLEPQKKQIELDIKKWNHQSNENPFCSLKNIKTEIEKKPINGYIYEFTGREIGEDWRLSISENTYHYEEVITPENSKEKIDVQLDQKKKIEIELGSNRSASLNFNIQDDNIEIFGNKIQFKNKAIDQKWEIDVNCQGFEDGALKITPSAVNDIHVIDLMPKKYQIRAGKNGTLINEKIDGELPFREFDKRDDLLKRKIRPNSGYKFKNFKTEGNTKTAQYERIPFYARPIYIGLISLTLILFVTAYFVRNSTVNKFEKNVEQKQAKYFELDEFLNGEELIDFGEIDSTGQKMYIIKEDSSYLFKLFAIFGISHSDSFNLKSNNEIDLLFKNKDTIRTIRRLVINEGKLDTLNHFQSFIQDTGPASLREFNKNVEKFDLIHKKKVSKILSIDTISKLNITQVNDLLKNLKELFDHETSSKSCTTVEEIEKEKKKIDAFFVDYEKFIPLADSIKQNVSHQLDRQKSELEESEKRIKEDEARAKKKKEDEKKNQQLPTTTNTGKSNANPAKSPSQNTGTRGNQKDDGKGV